MFLTIMAFIHRRMVLVTWSFNNLTFTWMVIVAYLMFILVRLVLRTYLFSGFSCWCIQKKQERKEVVSCLNICTHFRVTGLPCDCWTKWAVSDTPLWFIFIPNFYGFFLWRNVAIIKSYKRTRYAVDSIVTHDGEKLSCWPLADLSRFGQRWDPEAYEKVLHCLNLVLEIVNILHRYQNIQHGNNLSCAEHGIILFRDKLIGCFYVNEVTFDVIWKKNVKISWILCAPFLAFLFSSSFVGKRTW